MTARAKNYFGFFTEAELEQQDRERYQETDWSHLDRDEDDKFCQ